MIFFYRRNVIPLPPKGYSFTYFDYKYEAGVFENNSKFKFQFLTISKSIY